MIIYAYNPETECGYVYRFEEDGAIYERALQPLGGWDREGKMDEGRFNKEGIILGLLEDGFIVGTDKSVVLEHCKWALTGNIHICRIHIAVSTIDDEDEPLDIVYNISAYGSEAIGIDVPEELFDKDYDSDYPIDFFRKHICEAYQKEGLHWVCRGLGELTLPDDKARKIITEALKDGQLLSLSIGPRKACMSFGVCDKSVTVWADFDYDF